MSEKHDPRSSARIRAQVVLDAGPRNLYLTVAAMNDKIHIHDFDEQSALQALEQLRDQIQRARSRREQKLAEFETFLRSNRAASQAERSAALDELERSVGPVAAAARAADRAGESVLPYVVAAAPPRRMAPPAPRFDPFDSVPSRDRDPFAVAAPVWSDRRYQIAAAVAALVLLLLLISSLRGDDPPPAQSATAAPAHEAGPSSGDPASQPAGSQAASQSAPRAPVAAGAVRVELATTRPVWMRVVVDGERRVERQVAGGQKLTFGGHQSVAIRAGDAGAVRHSVNGVDRGALGGDGQVVNRTFRRGS